MTLTEQNLYMEWPNHLYKEKWSGSVHFIKKLSISISHYQLLRTTKHTIVYVFFYANGVLFLHTRPVKISLCSVKSCISREKGQIIKRIEIVKKIHETRGFNIIAYHVENEFSIQVLRMALLPHLIPICSRDKHIHVIEW